MRLSRIRIAAMIGAGWLAFFAFFTAYAQPAFEPGLARAIEVQERHTDALMSIPGVVGVGVGHDANGQPAVAILLDMREVRGLPSELEGIRVVTRKTDRIYARPKPCAQPPCSSGDGGGGSVDTTARFDRPVPIGVSTGHPAITAGTIGARVRDNANNVYALSNNHVYANESQATIGDAVIQPGTFDQGTSPADNIGTLAAFVPIYLNCSCTDTCTGCGLNTVDAAIASSTLNLLGNSTPSNGYGTPKTTIISPTVNMKVKKYGRTTGQTSGQIWAINFTVDVGYSKGIARFVNQIIIVPGSFSAGGDSGSLIVAEGKGRTKAIDGRPVGLLFAGSSSLTVANPIDAVLDAFNVTIDGQ